MQRALGKEQNMSKYRLGRKAARAAVTAAAVIFMTAQLSGCKEETGQNYQQTDNEETQQEEKDVYKRQMVNT